MGKKKKDNKNTKTAPQKKQGGKFPVFPVLIALIAIIGIGLVAYQKTSKGASTTSQITMENIEVYKGGETRPTLSPSLFRGKTASSYQVAGKIRHVLDYMYCYCNCKQSIGHKSLLNCFTDNHAANCGICQDQAFFANTLNDKGFDIAMIRNEMDKKFWRPLR